MNIYMFLAILFGWIFNCNDLSNKCIPNGSIVSIATILTTSDGGLVEECSGGSRISKMLSATRFKCQFLAELL